jgi:predicted nucleic acid-binding protein
LQPSKYIFFFRLELKITRKFIRRFSRSLSRLLTITGTVGLLLRYYKGKKENFKLALDELITKGFRLSEHEYEKFLEMANQGQDKEKSTDQ